MNNNQVQRLKKDSKQLEHYIYRLTKKGDSELAYKLQRKQQFLKQHIQDVQQTI